DLWRGLEDLLSAISGICEKRNLFAPRHGDSLSPQGRDLLARPARELIEELVLHLGEEIADRRNTVAAREDAQLEIVPEREAIARLRRNDLRLVANVLETFTRGNPGRHVRRGPRRDEDARRGQPGELPTRGVMRQAGHVIEMPVR